MEKEARFDGIYFLKSKIDALLEERIARKKSIGANKSSAMERKGIYTELKRLVGGGMDIEQALDTLKINNIMQRRAYVATFKRRINTSSSEGG